MQQSKMSRLSLAAVMGYDMPEETVQEGDGNTQPAGTIETIPLQFGISISFVVSHFQVISTVCA